MSVQRWDLLPAQHGYITTYEEGRFVLYADHVAALAEAEQRGRSEQHTTSRAIGYNAGYAEALGKAREAVAALVRVKSGTGEYVRYAAVLAVLDALAAEVTP